MKIRLANKKENDILCIDPDKVMQIEESSLYMEGRRFGEFADKAFWLSENVDWHIGTDNENELILVATRK